VNPLLQVEGRADIKQVLAIAALAATSWDPAALRVERNSRLMLMLVHQDRLASRDKQLGGSWKVIIISTEPEARKSRPITDVTSADIAK
jgi:uncharacterized protein (DUF1501 family)